MAGYFYPRNPLELKATIEEMVDAKVSKAKAYAVISPHAGYIYSGPVAGALFSSVRLTDAFIIMGPSHRYTQPLFAIMKKGTWQTPLGDVPLDTQLAEIIQSHAPSVQEDDQSHSAEHSLEVQLPFIQYFKKEFSIVPMCISSRAAFADLEDLGKALARSIRESGREILIVASTDMSHYVSQNEAREKDFLAIERILALDARGLYETVEKENISMCGVLPTSAAIVAAKEMGASRAELIKYQTSGDRTGDYREVVGYAGLRIV